MSTTENQASNIQSEMAQLRIDLHADVKGLVENARDLTDWQGYVRRNPWLFFGAAAVVGYMIVPAKRQGMHPDVSALAKLVKDGKLEVKVDAKPPTRSIVQTLFGMVAPSLLQGGLALVSQQLNQYMDPSPRRDASPREPSHDFQSR